MRIYELGDGTPEVAVVGAIHGDEPCGESAIERLVAEDPSVERPVKLVVANEEALERSVRYLDEDLNRAFPGDSEANSHERRLAAHLTRELRGCTTLSLHSTQSYAEPFAIVDTVDAVSRSVCPHLPIDAVVEAGEVAEGRLITQAHTFEVECGLQGSAEAAENAYWITRAFLAATGVLAAPLAGGSEAEPPVALGRPENGSVPVFRLERPIPKVPADEYEVYAHNFEEVDAGELFARAGDEEFVAQYAFVPVLLSAYGYEDVFGYVAESVGVLG
jgi:hypothetical protein